MAQFDDSVVSEIINYLKRKGIEVSPENIRQMIAQLSGKDYTLEQIKAIVVVNCERQHAREQTKKNGHENGLSI